MSSVSARASITGSTSARSQLDGRVDFGSEAAIKAAYAAAKAAQDAAADVQSAVDAAKAGAALAEDAAKKADAAAAKADAATEKAQEVVDDEEAHRLAAKASADAAAASAAAAASSQTAAKASADSAASSESAAASSAVKASESASAAASSEAKAKASETNAEESETSAAASKGSAASSATAAKASETSAAASKSSAGESAAAAKASADAAAASAAAAKVSETSAGQSATDASASKAAAAASATTAGEKATAAKLSESSAAASANSASASQTAAKSSQTASEKAADRAEAAASKAESIAGFTVDSAVTETSTNAVTSKAIYSFVSDMAEQIRTGMVEIVDSLPAEGKPGVIYMVAADNPTAGNLYAEYVWKNSAWEKLGDVQMPDLSPYAKTAEVAKAIQDALAAYTTTEALTGLLAKKQDALAFDAVPTAGSSNPVKSGGVKTALDAKADSSTVSALSESVTDLTSQHAADKAELEAGIAAKQDKLTIDEAVTAGSSNPVSSAAVASYVAENGGGKTLSNADFLELING